MEEKKKRICKRCLLREMEIEDYKKIEKYKDAIKESERVPKDIYELRLQSCKKCESLYEGTCNACGCYVELRALGIRSDCPHGKW